MERGREGWWYRYRVRLAVGGLLLLGAAFRFYGLDWDQNHHLHPDERAIVFATQRLSLPPVDEWPRFFNPLLAGESPNFFRADSPLNPGFFAYGSWPLYAVRILAAILASLAPFALPGSDTAIALSQINDFDHLTMLGRALSVFFDLGTIVVTYRLGKILLHRGAGLLAAGFVTFTVLNIQYSHFFSVDIPLTFFVALAIYLAVSYFRNGGRGRAALLGIATGLAIATKFAAAPLVLVALLAPILRYRKVEESPLASLGIVTLSMFLSFAIAQPYALLDWPTFWGQIVEQANMVRGVLDYPYTRQYVGTTPYIYHLVQSTVWGMGLPLGLIAWAGLAYSLRRNFLRPRPAEILLLAWVVPYFLITGSFYVKFLRYLLPLFPVLYVMGAQLLYALHGRLQAWLDTRYLEKGTRHLGKPIGYATAVLLISSGFIYTLAFAAIYSRPHTRIQASEWIRSNIPPGSTVTCEHWDDAVPLEVNCSEEQDTLGMYSVMRMDLYEPDNEAKYQEIREVLANADYIVLSSNRLYGSIPRSPRRYPISTRYYQLLFDGELGFRKIAVFNSYPSLGRVTIIDDWADESFTVYDHPKVLVFAKERNLTDQELAALFDDALEATPIAGSEQAWNSEKTLLLDRPVEELPAVTDIGWNSLANANPLVAVITWWAAIQLLGLVALPPTLLLFRRFADGGYILAKTLGWLLVGYLVWLVASLHLVMHILPTYLLAILGVALFSGYILFRRGGEIRALISSKRRIIIVSEALFAAAFLGFVGIRLLNPDLWQPWTGGEKSMEFAFLNAITKSLYFPPYDPYFAHGYINYYYYGLYLVAGLVKITGITPSVAFNLAVPTLFAVTVTNSFSLGYNLTRRICGGLAAFGFVALLGNLDGAVQLLEGLRNLIQGGSFPAFDYWRSSRVIPFTINEFPYWSFLFADLHPHMIGLPTTVFFLSVALRFALGIEGDHSPAPGRGDGSRSSGWPRILNFATLLLGFVLALSLGAVAVINLWDLPTYFLLLLGVFWLRWQSKTRASDWGRTLLAFAVVAGLSLVLYLPFYAHYAPLSAGVGLVETRTTVGAFLTIWGFILFVVASYLIIESRAGLAALANSSREIRLAILATVVVVATFFSLGEGVWGLLLPLVIISAYLYLRGGDDTITRFIHLLIFMGLAILLGTEIFFFRDFLQGGEYQRMNTVFKFYMQAWVLLGIGSAAILSRLFSQIRSLRPGLLSAAWQGAFIVLLLSSGIFLFLGTRARVEDRFPGERPAVGTLDGLAYMTVGRYYWPDQEHPIELSYDYQASQWLMANVQGTPVIAEAALPYYREGGLRVASYTGLPTLLGMHQNEQRYDWQVGQRDGEVRTFFETSDLNLTLELIRRLHIQYIYVGQLERIVYPSEGLAKFESLRAQGWLDLVYDNPQVLIYRLVQEAVASD